MNRLTNDDALFGHRLQLFDLAARTSVAEACRTMGVHRSAYYYRKRQVDRHGLEILRPRARGPAMPNSYMEVRLSSPEAPDACGLCGHPYRSRRRRAWRVRDARSASYARFSCRRTGFRRESALSKDRAWPEPHMLRSRVLSREVARGR